VIALAMPAAAGAQAVSFQAGPTHDGNAGAAGVDPPLRKAWTARVDGVPSYALVGSTWIAAHRQSDGTQLWIDSPGNGTNGSPAVTGGAVYVALPCGETRKLGRADGALLWQTPHDCAGGGGSTAVLAGGRLYTREREYPPGEVYDAADGRLLGRMRGEYAPAFRGAIGLFPDARRRGEHWTFGHRLVARSTTSGRVHWRFAGDGYLDTAPLIAGRVAYVGSGSGRVYGVALRSGRAIWRASVGAPVHGSGEMSGGIGGLAAAGGLLVVPAYGRVAAFR
jgi:outer membrane protein assembly factor BamB